MGRGHRRKRESKKSKSTPKRTRRPSGSKMSRRQRRAMARERQRGSQTQLSVNKIKSDNTATIKEGIREINNMLSRYFKPKSKYINIVFNYETVLAMSDEKANIIKSLLDRSILSTLTVACISVAKDRASYRRALRRNPAKKFFLDRTFYPLKGEDFVDGVIRIIEGVKATHYVDSNQQNILTILGESDSGWNNPAQIYFWGGDDAMISQEFKSFLVKRHKEIPSPYEKHRYAFHKIDTNKKLFASSLEDTDQFDVSNYMRTHQGGA